MKQTINNYQFHNAFEQANRSDNFSYEALDLLFEYFENLESDLGYDLEFDVIAICCEYQESTIDDIINDYSLDVSDCEDLVAKHALVSDFLNDKTTLVGESSNESYVFQSF